MSITPKHAVKVLSINEELSPYTVMMNTNGGSILASKKNHKMVPIHGTV